VAEQQYRSAQLREPDEAVASFNLGLALAQQEDYAGASRNFQDALNLAGERADFREKALYNLGLSQINSAIAESKKDKPDEEFMLDQALSALDAFNETLRLNPGNEEAAANKAQAQHFLKREMQEQQQQQQQQNQQQQNQQQQDQQQDQQQQQQQQQQNEQDQQQQQEQQQQQDQQQQADQNQEQQENQQQQDEQQQGQQQEEEQEQQGQPQDQQQPEEQEGQQEEERQGDQQREQPAELTEDQARQLLNLLGDERNIVLRKGRYPRSMPEPEKDW
jgi:hypothetical protein